jgi:hypothetical protein
VAHALNGAPRTADSTRSEVSAGMNENHAKLLLVCGRRKIANVAMLSGFFFPSDSIEDAN